MSRDIEIRQASKSDAPVIVALIEGIVDEVYGHLVESPPPIPADLVSVCDCWVAESDGEIVGVGIAEGDYVEDLWVSAQKRGQGIGATILSKLEERICSEGYKTARLRVVAENENARRFYRREGWLEVRTYEHERDHHLMVDCEKALENRSKPGSALG